MQRFDWNTPEYAEAFATLLSCSGERVHLHKLLRALVSNYPKDAHAIDWGAGGGDLTGLLLEYFQTVYAVEPNPEMRAQLSSKHPAARVFDGTIASTVPPARVDVGLISHVFYHVPDHKWGAYTVRAANHLTAHGVLVVALKDPDSGCNRMLEHFGAQRFDLYRGLARVIRIHPEFDFSFTRVPGSVVTDSFEDTLRIARFMMCDRDADAFSREPDEAQFQSYVREQFWNAHTGTGGWRYDVVLCLVRRNDHFQ
ncbi:MAG: methyltransferase domain-containing protein [Methylococcaceae bacterium]|nr:methyltransferase domain-containing protein [Methylococcaceae bacterium]MCI0732525.1 methyltransferase domain-containing protein [Methylococcaceae bacterium]